MIDRSNGNGSSKTQKHHHLQKQQKQQLNEDAFKGSKVSTTQRQLPIISYAAGTSR